MSTVPFPAVPRLTVEETSRLRVTQLRVLRSEWLKMRSLRSTWLTLGVSVVSMAGIGMLIAWSTANDWDKMRPRQKARFDPLHDPLSGFNLAQLATGVLGVLITAGEHSTGMIRATLAAVPRRLPVLWAKLGLFVAFTAITMLPTAVVTFLVSQRLLSSAHIQTSWSVADVPRTVIGVGLYLTVVAAIGIAVGAIVRNVAASIAVVVGVLLVLPVVADALPDTWGEHVNKWLPSNAGQALLGGGSRVLGGGGSSLGPWQGFGVFSAYAVGAVIVAAVLLRLRDA
jgi:ABC-2 type transport system permease protein